MDESSPDDERIQRAPGRRWEPTSALDRFSVALYRSFAAWLRWLLVITAAGTLAGLALVSGLGALADPVVLGLIALSATPALGLALFIKLADIGAKEPATVLFGTFVLGVLFAVFAGVLNTIGLLALAGIPFVSTLLFFFLIVGPVEEGVKLAAVRLYAYRDRRFDAVIDGAIYGAAAGLGFATIENALYITDALAVLGETATALEAVGETTAVRALVGPGHVIYSAIAGFYLGLAKFNRRFAGALVIKGLTIAAVIHATYNALVQSVPGLIAGMTGLDVIGGLLVFIIIFDGLAGYYLYRLLVGYRQQYRSMRRRPDRQPALVEFDGR